MLHPFKHLFLYVFLGFGFERIILEYFESKQSLFKKHPVTDFSFLCLLSRNKRKLPRKINKNAGNFQVEITKSGGLMTCKRSCLFA